MTAWQGAWSAMVGGQVFYANGIAPASPIFAHRSDVSPNAPFQDPSFLVGRHDVPPRLQGLHNGVPPDRSEQAGLKRQAGRSEERRVGKGGVSRCKSRGSP